MTDIIFIVEKCAYCEWPFLRPDFNFTGSENVSSSSPLRCSVKTDMAFK